MGHIVSMSDNELELIRSEILRMIQERVATYEDIGSFARVTAKAVKDFATKVTLRPHLITLDRYRDFVASKSYKPEAKTATG